MMIDLTEGDGDLLGMNATTKNNGGDDGDIYKNGGGPFVSLS